MSKNKFNLKLPPGSIEHSNDDNPGTETPQRKASTGASGSFGAVSLESLLKCIEELDMDDTQRRRLEIFLVQKQKFL